MVEILEVEHVARTYYEREYALQNKGFWFDRDSDVKGAFIDETA